MRAQAQSRPILFFSDMEGCPWGGSEELWYAAALRLRNKGWPVAASVLQWPQPPRQIGTLRSQGVQVVERPKLPPLSVRVLNKVLPQRRYEWLRQMNPQFVVFSQGLNWSLMTAEWADLLRSLKIPYVVVAQCAFPWLWPSDEQASRVRLALQEAKRAYFVSDANLSLTRMQLGSAVENGKVIRNPFAVDYDAPLPWPEGKTLRLAFVARLEPGIKGHDLLMGALSSNGWQARDLSITLYGSGVSGELVRSLQQSMRVTNVDFGGFVHPRDIWAQNHALLLPSRAEGLPVALVEAMLCGRPCIVTDAGGNAEVVEDGVTGFVARDATPAALNDALERAWVCREDWKSMGECAARRIRQLVSADPAGDFVSELEQLIAAS